jgi:hypothetical protein
MNWLNEYGNTEGPLGFPMPDKQARALELLLKALPKGEEFKYRKSVVAKQAELLTGERSDVSWISTKSVDRQGDVVFAKGMNDAQFAQNPLVTLNHAYWAPPAGRSVWRKFAKDGELRGVKAKTIYPAKPEAWGEDPWVPDKAFALCEAGLLNAKSIGFLPTKVHVPTNKERETLGKDTQLVIEEWLMLEYACVFLPANQDAVVEQVSKGLEIPEGIAKALGIEARPAALPPPPGSPPPPFAFTTLEDVDKAINSRIAGINWEQMAEKALTEALDKARGRV